MSNLIRTLRAFTILAGLVSLPALAGDGPTFNVGGSLLNQLESAKNITNNSLGYSITGGVDWNTSHNYVVRTGLAINFLPGSAFGDTGRTDAFVKTSLMGYQIFSDIHIPSANKNLSFVAGLSLQKWNFRTSKPATSVSPIGADASSGTIKGLKFGMRLGLEWKFNTHWSGELMMQQTELGSQDNEVKGNTTDPTYLSNENPGWFQVGARYHF